MLMRIERRRARGWRMPPNTVSVTRPGIWGNPYYPGSPVGRGFIDEQGRPLEIDMHSPLNQVRLFRLYIDQMRRERPHDYEKYLRPLRGRHLACWCKLCPVHIGGKPRGVECPRCEPCHADVLLECAAVPPVVEIETTAASPWSTTQLLLRSFYDRQMERRALIERVAANMATKKEADARMPADAAWLVDQFLSGDGTPMIVAYSLIELIVDQGREARPS